MKRSRWLAALALIHGASVFAQPCLLDYTITANPAPVGGQYAAGQNVQFCLDINLWDQAGINWLHGVVPSFGPGWDLSTFVPGVPPPECGFFGGTWVFANSVTGTSPFSVGAVGPGWFFDLDNDGDPGNNLGDDCFGTWTFCFTISVNSGVNCINGADLTVTFDTYGDSETGSWGTAGCGGDILPSATATALCCSANAGTDGFADACVGGPPVDLFNFLGNFPDVGGQWTDPFGNPVFMPIDPAFAIAGDYVYTVMVPGCLSDQAIVSLNIIPGANAGFDAFISVCDQGAPTDLFPNLFGADPGGFWTDPFGNFFSGFYNPIVDVPGVYTYEVFGFGGCPGDQATVTVDEVSSPDPGLSSVVDLCFNSPMIDLYASLGGTPDPGGSWTGPIGANNGLFSPIFDPPGVYTYQLFAPFPCLPANASVTVNVNFPPPSGLSAPVVVCSGDPLYDLYTPFIGQLPAGGSWTDNNGNPFNGMLDPGTMTSGIYTYSIAGIAPCPDGTNTVDVTVNPSPDPGIGGLLVVCGSDVPVALFSSLLGTPDPGGAWTDPIGNPHSGVLNPAVDIPGFYTYTVPANGLCPAASTTVEVQIVAPANAGNNAAIAVCENDPNIVLSTLIGVADPGGVWTGPSGGASNGIVDPTSLDAGGYTYTVDATAPCIDAVSVVTVTIDTLPDAGVDNVISLCADQPAQDLFLLLAPADSGGTWTAPDGSPFSGSFDPSIALTGDYTYTVSATGACAGEDDVSVVTATAFVIPSPVFAQDTTMGCEPLDINFTLLDPNVTQSEWHFGDGASSGGVLDAAHTYEESGFYDVTVSVLDDNGCADTLTVDSAVQVHETPNPHFVSSPNPVVTLEPDVNFTTAVTDYPVYYWTVDGDSVSTGTPTSIHFQFFTPQIYEVCLLVIDTNFCQAEECQDVVVRQELALHVPNAFTPNGNGINELFYPVVLGASDKDYEFAVFDRWGELVFESKEIGEGWNGGMKNSETRLETGVFTWRVRLREEISAERKEIYGHVSLLK